MRSNICSFVFVVWVRVVCVSFSNDYCDILGRIKLPMNRLKLERVILPRLRVNLFLF